MASSHRSKADLRVMLRARRAALDSAQQRIAATALQECITTRLPAWAGAQRIAVYIANDGEIDAEPLGSVARSLGKEVYLPVIAAGATLEFARWDAGAALVDNRYGIPEPTSASPRCEPATLDIVFVPVVGWDPHCNRLGMGAGFYDRTLAAVRGPLLVGLAHEVQRVEHVPRESWDIGMDYIATDAALYRRRGGENAEMLLGDDNPGL